MNQELFLVNALKLHIGLFFVMISRQGDFERTQAWEASKVMGTITFGTDRHKDWLGRTC
jgi:hypothetical protein